MSKEGGALSSEQAKAIEQTLTGYLGESGIKTVLLVDPDGHLVSQAGSADKIDPVAFGALISANFASTQQIASQMDEREFDAFFIQGKEQNLYLHAVEDRAILVSIFLRTTTLGMVKVFAEKTVKQLTEALAAGGEGKEGMSVGSGFADSALAELDKVLGG